MSMTIHLLFNGFMIGAYTSRIIYRPKYPKIDFLFILLHIGIIFYLIKG